MDAQVIVELLNEHAGQKGSTGLLYKNHSEWIPISHSKDRLIKATLREDGLIGVKTRLSKDVYDPEEVVGIRLLTKEDDETGQYV
jgi:hypothetical protein